jgi:hypothetical protein
MNGRSWGLAATVVVALASAACNSGGRAGGKQAYGGVAGVGSTTGATIDLVVMSRDLLEAADPSGATWLWLWIDAPNLTEPTMWVDDGGGWREYSFATFTYWHPGSPLPIQGSGPAARYQVRGKLGGQPAWSNVVVQQAIDWTRDWGVLSVTEPRTATFGPAPLAANVTRATWTPGPPATTRYLFVLWRREVWLSTTGGPADALRPVSAAWTASTSWRFDDLTQRVYATPPSVPLPPDEYAITVVAVDATGWAFASSNVGPPPPWALLRDRESYHHFDVR